MSRSNSNSNHAKDHPKRGFSSFLGLGINILIALGSLTISGWCAYDIISQPFLRLRAAGLMIMTFTLAIATNRSFAILQRFVKMRKLHRGIGILKWLATLFVPLACMSIPNNMANNRSVEIAKKHLAPLVKHIEHEQHKLTYPPLDILQGFEEIGRFSQVTYYRGDKHFVISIDGGSIDIDGSTIYYNSLAQQWLRIHNDMIGTDRGEPYRKAVKGLDSIRYGFKADTWVRE